MVGLLVSQEKRNTEFSKKSNLEITKKVTKRQIIFSTNCLETTEYIIFKKKIDETSVFPK